MNHTSRPHRSRRITTLFIAGTAVLVLASCSSEPQVFPDDSFSVVANSDLGVGTAQLQVGVIGIDNARLGGPDDPVSFEVVADGSDNPVKYEAEWIWVVPDLVGLYRSQVAFGAAGVWSVSVLPETGPALPPTLFQVSDQTFAPNVGHVAPIADIDTMLTRPLNEITTDQNPDEDFYQLTLEEAFTSGRQTVVVFSTPAFCQTAACGPTLDIVKAAKPQHPDVNFVHVEIYEGFHEPGFAPSTETLTPAVVEWNLPSEPWVFVVDEDGVVTARFEGSLVPDDLHDILP